MDFWDALTTVADHELQEAIKRDEEDRIHVRGGAAAAAAAAYRQESGGVHKAVEAEIEGMMSGALSQGLGFGLAFGGCRLGVKCSGDGRYEIELQHVFDTDQQSLQMASHEQSDCATH